MIDLREALHKSFDDGGEPSALRGNLDAVLRLEVLSFVSVKPWWDMTERSLGDTILDRLWRINNTALKKEFKHG